MPMRPIVSASNTIFTGLTKEMGRILSPLVSHTEHHLKDSTDLKGKLEHVTIPSTHRLFSYDLSNMYTNIPTKKPSNLLGKPLKPTPN